MSGVSSTPNKNADRFLVETIILSSKEPVSYNDLQNRIPRGVDIHDCLTELSREYESRSITLLEVAGGWTIRTKPECSDLCRKLLAQIPRMSNAALETLTIIAYFQPVTRSEIERVRGVTLAKGTLDILIWAGYVRPGARRASPGNPLTFVTTEAFLRQFNLNNLDDLPEISQLRSAGLLNAEKGFSLDAVAVDSRD